MFFSHDLPALNKLWRVVDFPVPHSPIKTIMTLPIGRCIRMDRNEYSNTFVCSWPTVGLILSCYSGNRFLLYNSIVVDSILYNFVALLDNP